VTEGWARCALGHVHWGRAGAAGLLLHRDGHHGPEVLLQHRAPSVQHPRTWSIPGGGLHAGEPPLLGALREAREEMGLPPGNITPGPVYVDDHGGWTFTTVLARPTGPLEVSSLRLNREATTAAWLRVDQLDAVRLHPGLAATLPQLRSLIR
jgi:8-oxo-dGTP pyrophosphatase MutT (NUDIX family)